jgi:hypothetical protein
MKITKSIQIDVEQELWVQKRRIEDRTFCLSNLLRQLLEDHIKKTEAENGEKSL